MNRRQGSNNPFEDDYNDDENTAVNNSNSDYNTFVLGDEHPTFALFVRRHVGDEFEFKGSPIRIDGIIVED